MSQQRTIYVIDDNLAELALVNRITRTLDVSVNTYQSPEVFLAELPSEPAGCIMIDLQMPKMSGLELYEELKVRNIDVPIIIVTGQADARSCRQALQSGAFDYVEKGWRPFDILEVLQRGLDQFEADRAKRQSIASALEKLSAVSARECEVMNLLAEGQSLKELSQQLGITVQTASKHRASLFRKLGISNDIELLKFLISSDVGCPATDSQDAA